MILQGDALEMLRTLPDNSVHCVVTSPPYWNLRDYGVEGQLGLEKTPQEYIAKMVEIFEEVRRVLRKDGTCWVNMGDSYFGDSPCRTRSSEAFSGTWDTSQTASKGGKRRSAARLGSLKRKDLCGMPWRLALALQDAGWYLRSDIIWSKPNPMPKSVKDRPSDSHEYIFLLTKSAKYWYDAGAISEPCSPNTHLRVSQDVASQLGSERANGGSRADRPMKAVVRGSDGAFGPPQTRARVSTPDNYKGSVPGRKDGPGQDRRSTKDRRPTQRASENMGRAPGWRKEVEQPITRNARTVWTIAIQGYAKAHFATFPTEIPRRCILAGCPEGGTVLDPFLGSGTTIAVAISLGRLGIGIELNPEYVELARQRIASVTPGFQFEEVA